MSRNSYSYANSSKILNRRIELSDLICSCGTATCYKFSGSKANVDRRYLCYCKNGLSDINIWEDVDSNGGMIRNLVQVVTVIPILLRLIENNDEIAIKKAKEVMVLKMLMFSWIKLRSNMRL
ncbi:hypothetical protein HanHA300_Chr04g0144411 [Helianthus annuus]|nr:hypothetical protein HanHA300_Chr04g0144411 [Helianthus annuus]KAJ0589776.1 hypothetical protein HanIR_Chr04g0190031 [Helianthus annuus]KAJ0758339.1 hypothetical protein HanLR1_Chr04g0149261 [Helianthus annuus]KAJ0761998.1 hypothetical protein HanOQP8_Chr04g0156451 [Helianthus annuus]KAJ0932134.1 hypothetical protein HanPSC8_Chr04g0170131 [Helianthus annuus]